MPAEEESPPGTPEGRRWGWLGLAAGAAALTMIALWFAVGGRSSGDEEEPQEPPSEEGDVVPTEVD